jgi:TetR/AcrR family transcriptional regulator
MTISPSHSTQEPRWRRLPEERPKQILEAALAVFGERGLSNARLDDIAKRAGVSKGTIYLYFPNKEELFREVIRSTVVVQIEQAELDVANATGTATEALTFIMRGSFEFLRTPTFASIFRLVNAELFNFPDLAEFYANEVVERKQRLIIGILERGIESGEFRPIDPAISARVLTSMFLVHGLWCSHRKLCASIADRSDEEVFNETLQFGLSAITARP